MLANDDDDEFQRCTRHVPKIKNEDASSKKYWLNLFEKYDADIRIPPHKRLDVLQDVFEEDLLNKILNILTVDNTAMSERTDESAAEAEEKRAKLEEELRLQRLSIENIKITDSYHEIDYRKKLTAQKAVDRVEGKGGANMYLNFLNLPDNVAARWRPEPPITFTGMSLAEKSEAITLSIATKFVEWMRGLGGDETITLDVPGIMNLFEIGFNAHAADSLCVKVTELLSVTKSIAAARWMPEASYTAHLYKQLYRDINSIKKQEDMFAFGTMLPIEMREAPQKDNIATKWIQNKRVPENIASMATVWEGIENMRSTMGYCKWLYDHAYEVDPPKYLDKLGLVNSNIDLDKAMSHYSVSTTDSRAAL